MLKKNLFNKKCTYYNLCRACLDCNEIIFIQIQDFNKLLKVIGIKKILHTEAGIQILQITYCTYS